MISLHNLKNETRKDQSIKRVGRGPSSGMGKTSGRGMNGDKSRSGYKRRFGKEGGSLPLYRKMPTRGFTRGRFLKDLHIVSLWQLEKAYNDGEEVTEETLRDHGFISGNSDGIKLLANGELTKKVVIKVNAISAGAKKKLEQSGISYEIV